MDIFSMYVYSQIMLKTDLVHWSLDNLKLKITIISTDERISVLILQLSINIFFSLLKCNVHIAVQTSQNS